MHADISDDQCVLGTNPVVVVMMVQALQREHMRTTDRAFSNLESHPEGFNALRRMYENVQVPHWSPLSPDPTKAQGNKCKRCPVHACCCFCGS